MTVKNSRSPSCGQELAVKVIHPRAFSALSVVRLGRTDWRISSGVDGEELLGYIERQSGGRFEVLWMSDPVRWGYVDSFDEALVAFGDSVRFSGEVFGDRARVPASHSEPLFHPARRASWLRASGRSIVA
jgi:hypothetical protein